MQELDNIEEKKNDEWIKEKPRRRKHKRELQHYKLHCALAFKE